MAQPRPQSQPVEAHLDLVPECSSHPGVLTRLSCTQCDTPICPKCMVQCAVGHKCKTCVQKTAGHASQVSKKHYLIGAVLGLAAGGLFGYIAPGMGFGYWGLLLAYAGGMFTGKGIHKGVQHKLSNTLFNVITLGAVLGMAVGILALGASLLDPILWVANVAFIIGIRHAFTAHIRNWR